MYMHRCSSVANPCCYPWSTEFFSSVLLYICLSVRLSIHLSIAIAVSLYYTHIAIGIGLDGEIEK